MTTQINPGYATTQLLRTTNDDRARTWEDVLSGMLSGQLRVGNRAPTGDPVWVTPLVLHGGFVAPRPGQWLAGGPILEAEVSLLRVLQAEGLLVLEGLFLDGLAGATGEAAAKVRQALNSWSIGCVGMEFWMQRLRDGCLRVEQAEEGACLVIALLQQADRLQPAKEVLSAIMPWFTRLRFYPRIADTPVAEGSLVSRMSVANLRHSLANACNPTPQVLLQAWSLQHRLPLYNKLVQLVESTEGAEAGSWYTHRTWLAAGNGAGMRAQIMKELQAFRAQEAEVLALGQAAANAPKGVSARLSPPNRWNWTDLQDDETQQQTRFMPQSMRKGGYAILKNGLTRFAENKDTPLDRETIATVMRTLKKRSEANSNNPQMPRVSKCFTAVLLRDLVIQRLSSLPPDQGILSAKLAQVLSPVSAVEAESQDQSSAYRLVEGEAIPSSLVDKCAPVKMAPLEELVAEGIIPSAEVLATIVRPLTAAAKTADCVQQEEPRRLMQLLYRAFAARRSLLLLQLASQVAIHELPWFAALRANFADRLSSTQGSDTANRQCAASLVSMTVKYFGGQALPNELVTELQPLMQGVPLVKAVAADIFEDAFSAKYVALAKAVADPHTGLDGTIYERYYSLASAFATIRELPEDKGTVAFHDLCQKRSLVWLAGGEDPSVALRASCVVQNGACIEQAAILTAHNYHMLIKDLGLHTNPALMQSGVEACLTKLKHLLRRGGAGDTNDWKAKLHVAADAASAIRNLLVFAAFLERAGQTAVIVKTLEDALRTVTIAEGDQQPSSDAASPGRGEGPTGQQGQQGKQLLPVFKRCIGLMNDMLAAARGERVSRPLLGWSFKGHPW